MIVIFYGLQKHTETNETRENFLLFDKFSVMMNEQYFTHESTRYKVFILEWINKKKGILKALCHEISKI